MKKLALGIILFGVSIGFCQTPSKQPDTLQALLAEVHQLRQNIEGMTVASQRVQIALYGLQMQDAAVARANQRLDSSHARCSGPATNLQHTAAAIQRAESGLASGTVPEHDLAEVKATLPQLKSGYDALTAEVQTCQATEAEASAQLRSEQAKLTELQDRVDRLDKALEQLSASPKQ